MSNPHGDEGVLANSSQTKKLVLNKLREFERSEVTERARTMKAKAMLRQAEQVFTDFFLSKIAPSPASETKRTEIFKKLHDLIQRAVGKFTGFSSMKLILA